MRIERPRLQDTKIFGLRYLVLFFGHDIHKKNKGLSFLHDIKCRVHLNGTSEYYFSLRLTNRFLSRRYVGIFSFTGSELYFPKEDKSPQD